MKNYAKEQMQEWENEKTGEDIEEYEDRTNGADPQDC